MGNIKDVLSIAKEKGYHVDVDGNVFSIKKKIALRKAQNRYHFTIRYYGQRVTIPVHKFVAFLKYGEKIFEDGIEVRHFNNNSLNNAWNNILIGTHSENMLDIPKNNRIKNSINASKNMRRFNDEEVQQIIIDRKSGFTYKKLCEKHNTSNSTLFYLLNNSYYSGIKKIE